MFTVQRYVAVLSTTATNKMQSEMADFVPLPPPGELEETIRVVFDSDLFPPLYGNVTSSTKPEVHNPSHCRQRRNEPRLQVTCTGKLVKFGRVAFEIRKQRDKQADIHTR